MLAFLKALDPKVWLAIIVGLIVMGICSKLAYDSYEIGKLKKENVVQGVTIAVQKDTIKTDGKVADIKNDVQTAVAADVKKVEVVHKTIQTKVDVKEREIERMFDALPETPTNMVEEQQQLSTARIDGMWEAYCAAKPDALDCQVKPPQGEPHA